MFFLFFFTAHVRRFMKGIAELGEVMKTVIPAFSPIPPPPSFNGTTISPRVPFSEQLPPGVPLETSLRPSENPPLEGLPSVRLPEPLLEPYHDEAGSRPRQDSTGQNAYAANSVLKSESSSSFSRMKNVLEAQMGLSGSRESLSHGEESESSEAAMPKFDSRSPSASPQVQQYFWL